MKVLSKSVVLMLMLFAIGSEIAYGQDRQHDDLDALVNAAIQQSEKAIYDADFEKADKKIQPSVFSRFSSLSDTHKMQLMVQHHRVQGFKNILFLLKPNPEAKLNKLLSILDTTRKITDRDTVANYFLALSSAHRATGKIRLALANESSAESIFRGGGNLGKVAEIRAGRISRIHNVYLRDKKKKEIIALIPRYKKEIEFSTKHSKYALAYNTRHLAQIHRRQTGDYEESLRLFKKSLELREEIGFRPFIPASYSSVGDVYLKLGDHKNAIENYLESARLAKDVGFIRYEVHPLINVAEIYLSLDDKKTARSYYEKALATAKSHKYKAGIDETSAKLARLATN